MAIFLLAAFYFIKGTFLELASDLRVDAQEDARREDEDRQEKDPSDGHDELFLETAQMHQHKGPLSARYGVLSQKNIQLRKYKNILLQSGTGCAGRIRNGNRSIRRRRQGGAGRRCGVAADGRSQRDSRGQGQKSAAPGAAGRQKDSSVYFLHSFLSLVSQFIGVTEG